MYLSLYNVVFVAGTAFIGGLVNTTVGFGGGIFVMLFWPMIFPVVQASGLSTLVCLSNTLMLAWEYRAHAQRKLVIYPLMFYFVVSFIAIKIATTIDVESLTALFGLFLILLAIYFIFFSERVKIKPTLPTAAVCSSISATASGMFGIGGPPMALYFLTITGSIPAYIGTAQFFFGITSSYNTIVRAFNGVFTWGLLLLAIPGILGMWGGKIIGLKIVKRMNLSALKKVIYVFLGISGVVTLVKSLIEMGIL